MAVKTLTVKMHGAKTHLSRLIDQAAQGREFVIAMAGKPMVRVIPMARTPAVRTLRLLAGQGVVQPQLKEDFGADIDAIFSSPR